MRAGRGAALEEPTTRSGFRVGRFVTTATSAGRRTALYFSAWTSSRRRPGPTRSRRRPSTRTPCRSPVAPTSWSSSTSTTAARPPCSTSPGCRSCASWSTADDGRVRLGAGVTYTRIIDELGDRLPGLAMAVAHGRLAADPQPRHGRRQPRRRLAGRRQPPAAARRRRRGRGRLGARRPARSRPPSSTPGVKRNALAPDELITAVLDRAGERARSSSARSAPATRW